MLNLIGSNADFKTNVMPPRISMFSSSLSYLLGSSPGGMVIGVLALEIRLRRIVTDQSVEAT